MATGFGQEIHSINVKPPIAVTDTAVTEMVDLFEFIDLEFHSQMGAMSSSDATGTWTIMLYSSSTTTAAGAAIAFKYRLQTTTALTDALGDVTSAAATGVALTSDNDNTLMIVKVDPREVCENEDGKRYVYLACDAATDDNATAVWAVEALGIPRHRGNSMKSSTA